MVDVDIDPHMSYSPFSVCLSGVPQGEYLHNSKGLEVGASGGALSFFNWKRGVILGCDYAG